MEKKYPRKGQGHEETSALHISKLRYFKDNNLN